MSEATARLEGWYFLNGVLYGAIYDDTKMRFRDGTPVHTSTVTAGHQAGEGEVVTTRNSTYLLGKPAAGAS